MWENVDGYNQHSWRFVSSVRVMKMAFASLLGSNKEEYVEDLLEEYDEFIKDYYTGVEGRYFLNFDKTTKQAKLQ